jgi:hypothetical protein
MGNDIVQQPGDCCSKDAVDTDGYGPYRGIRIDVGRGRRRGVRDGGPEPRPGNRAGLRVAAERRARETAAYGTSFVAVRRDRTLLVEARAVTPRTSEGHVNRRGARLIVPRGPAWNGMERDGTPYGYD